MSDEWEVDDRPDPADVIAGALPGEPEKALAVLEALRQARCLREAHGDWLPIPDDALLVADIRVADYMAADGSSKFSMRHDGTMTFSNVLGLFDLAKESVLATWRNQQP